MSNIKEKEKKRLSEKSFTEMEEWLTTMPLSNKNVEKNLYYMADFVAVVNHLKLPQNSNVLELGCGSCWPSEWLYRMGYRTVSADISHDMLRLGRKRFEPLKRERDNYVLHAHFVCSDAEYLPFNDEVFDAVVIFNAFHHFPDFERSLTELHRILRPSGRVVFAEPGEGHAQSDEALREMAEHGVLEKEICIDEIHDLARSSGFTEIEVILQQFPDRSLAYDDWKRMNRCLKKPIYRLRVLADLFRYRRKHPEAMLLHDLVSRQRHHPCMVLRKSGESIIDSRRPNLLRCTLADLHYPRQVQAGHPFTLKAKMENVGDTVWISQEAFMKGGAMNLGEGGYVNLGVKLFSGEGELLDDNYGRGLFSGNIGPAEEKVVTALLRAPKEPGDYVLKIDPVVEGITWFEDRGSRPLKTGLQVVASSEEPLFTSRFPDILSASITPLHHRMTGSAGALGEIVVDVENLGNTVWLQQPPSDEPPCFGGGYVRIGLQLRNDSGKLIDLNFARCPLPRDIFPGERERLNVGFTCPTKGGRYTLHCDLVDENITWFETVGSSPAQVLLEVTDGAGL